MTKVYIGISLVTKSDTFPEINNLYLSIDELQQATCLKNPMARLLFIEGRILRRRMLATLLQEPPEDICFEIDLKGKPCLSGRTDWHFNISHSGQLVACVCSKIPLGLDVEWHTGLIKWRDIAIRYFGTEEAKEILLNSSSEAFYHFWTLKESWLKLNGLGLKELQMVTDFTISRYSKECPGKIQRRSPANKDAYMAIWDLSTSMIAVPKWRSSLQIIEPNELITMCLAAEMPWECDWSLSNYTCIGFNNTLVASMP